MRVMAGVARVGNKESAPVLFGGEETNRVSVNAIPSEVVQAVRLKDIAETQGHLWRQLIADISG